MLSRSLKYKHRPLWARYGLTVGCVVVAWLGREALTPLIGPTALPFIFFFPAVTVSAWYGGLGAGIVATILSAAAANWAFVPLVHTWSVLTADDYILVFFVGASGFIVGVVQIMHRSTARLLDEVAVRQQAEQQNMIEAQADHRLLRLGNHCSQWGENFEECLTEILDAAIELTRADKGNLQLLDAKTGALVLTAQRGFDKPFLDFFSSVHDDTAAVCGAAMQSAQRVMVEDVTRSEIFANQPSLDVLLEAGVRAVQSTPLISSDGKTVGMISTHFAAPHRLNERELRFIDLLARQAADYIERNRAVQELRDNERRLRAFLENSATTAWLKDEEGRYVFVSANCGKRWGLPLESWKGKTDLDLWPDAAEELRRNDRAVLQSGRATEITERIEMPDGDVSWWLNHKFVFCDAAGRRYVGGLGVEVTQRKQAEATLRESEERNRALVSILADVPWSADANGVLFQPSLGFRKFTGRSEESENGPGGWVGATHPDDRAHVDELWRRACEQGQPFEAHARIWHGPSQSYRYCVGRAIPLWNADGSVREWVGALTDVHEQKTAEEALRSREHRFRLMADSAPVMIWLAGTDKLCTWFNRQWIEFTGRSQEQESGNGWAEGVHKEDFQQCLKTYTESFDARRSFVMEYRLRRHDGEWRWVRDHGVPLYEGENFVGYIGSCIDVTLEKKAAEALGERRKELEAIIDQTPFMLTRCDSDLRYTFVSRAYAKMLGRKPEEIVGKPIAEIIGQDGFKTILPHIEKVLSGRSVEYQSEVHFQDIGLRALDVTYTPEEDEKGNVQGWIASILDITERNKAEAARQQTEQRFERLVQNVPDIIARFDRQHRHLFISNAVKGLTDMEPRDFIGKSNAELGMNPELSRLGDAKIDEAFAGKTSAFEFTYQSSDRSRDLICVLVPEKNQDGSVQSVLSITRDVTEPKRVEKELREALRTKDQFLARVSHELRTPLAPVTMMAGILQRDNTLPQSVRDALDVIVQSVKFEAKLVDDLLDLSRVNTGKFHLELSECDIHQVVENAVRVSFGESGAKQLSLITKLNARERTFPADAVRLQQVFCNLIQNAIKFTSPGGVITVGSRDDNGQLCVDVSDNGSGIDPDMLERIFEPFAQDDAGMEKESQRGLGLGLPIARHIVAAHGGTIVARSEGMNRGATFTVSLPSSAKHRNSQTP